MGIKLLKVNFSDKLKALFFKKHNKKIKEMKKNIQKRSIKTLKIVKVSIWLIKACLKSLNKRLFNHKATKELKNCSIQNQTFSIIQNYKN